MHLRHSALRAEKELQILRFQHSLWPLRYAGTAVCFTVGSALPTLDVLFACNGKWDIALTLFLVVAGPDLLVIWYGVTLIKDAREVARKLRAARHISTS